MSRLHYSIVVASPCSPLLTLPGSRSSAPAFSRFGVPTFSLFHLLTWVPCLLLAAAPAARAADRPDIVILLTDQQQAAAMSIAGTPGLKTPHMDALAREGARFTHAFCSTPQCSPARAALWTGLYPHRTGVMGNVAAKTPPPAGMSGPLDPKTTTIGEIFAAAGYETAYFGKWHLGSDPGRHGFETHDISNPRGNNLTKRVLAFLEKRQANARQAPLRPLLLIVSYINPHDIYQITKATEKDLVPLKPIRLPMNLADDLVTKPSPQRQFRNDDQGSPIRTYSHDDWRRYITFYYLLTEKVDAEIGHVVRAVRQNNPQSLICFTSDHGDFAGAHGMPFKGPAMYEELVRIPLILSWPGHVTPAVRDELVGHIDLLPTLCDLACIAHPTPLDGHSLQPLLNASKDESPAWGDAVFVEYLGKQRWRVPIRMIRTRDWKYVRYQNNEAELYCLRSDPYEWRNLIGEDAYRQQRRAFSARLDQWIHETRDPFASLSTTDRRGQALSRDQATSSHSSP